MVCLRVLHPLCIIIHTFVIDDNKKEIVKEGAVPTFIELLRSNDVKLQNEAVGALRNLSVDGKLVHVNCWLTI